MTMTLPRDISFLLRHDLRVVRTLSSSSPFGFCCVLVKRGQ